MIKSIRFKNYKSFTDWTELNFKPITILVGPNSSGKSSIIKLVYRLMKSATHSDLKEMVILPFGNLKKHFQLQAGLLSISKSAVSLWPYQKEEVYIKNHDGFKQKVKIVQPYHPLKIDFNKNILNEIIPIKLNLKLGYHLEEYNLANNRKINALVERIDLYKLEFNKKQEVVLNEIRDDEGLAFEERYQNLSVFQFNVFKWLNSIRKDLNKIFKNVSFKNNLVEKRFLNYYSDFFKNFELDFKVIAESLLPPVFYSYYVEAEVKIDALLKKIAGKRIDELFKKFNKENINLSYLQKIDKILTNYFKDKEIIKIDDSKLLEIKNKRMETALFDEEILNDFYKMIKDINELEEKITFIKEKYDFLDLIILKNVAIFFIHLEQKIQIQIKANINDSKILQRLRNNQMIEYLKPLRLDYVKDFSEYQNIISDDRKRGGESQELIDNINKFFKEFELPYYLRKIDKTVEFFDRTKKFKQSISDVGFGYSQVLPIIIKCLKNVVELILIEQPEAQLHPKFQSQLADLFYESVIKNYNQLIIETHSEYLIRRFQVLIAQGKMTPDDISIYYVDKDEKGRSHVKEMELDETGQFLTEWPSGFFDESYKHAIEMLR